MEKKFFKLWVADWMDEDDDDVAMQCNFVAVSTERKPLQNESIQNIFKYLNLYKIHIFKSNRSVCLSAKIYIQDICF